MVKQLHVRNRNLLNLYHKLKFETLRGIESLVDCHAKGSSDVLFKVTTLANLAKKGCYFLASRKISYGISPWIFKGTTVAVNFLGITYSLPVPKDLTLTFS